MSDLMSIDARYELILSQEQQFAKKVAVKTVDKPEFSLWIILIPIFFVYYIYRSQRWKSVLELCSKEFVFTKKTALDAALDMTQNGASKTEAIAACPSDQGEGKKEEAKEINKKQMQEIEFLIDHYVKLLKAEGDSYQSLLENAYQRRNNYAQFLNLLQQAEKEVNLAAKRAFSQTEGFSEMISRMETATEALRTEEKKAVFP